MFETSILAAFGAMFCWGIGDFLIQRTARKIGDVEALALIGIIGGIGLLPFVAKEIPLLFSVENIVLLVFLGALTFVAAMFNFEALKKGKLSVIEIIIEFELPITILLGLFFFHETLSLQQSFLILLVFIGIVLVAVNCVSSKIKNGIEKGVLLGLVAAAGMAFVNFFTAAASKQVSPLMAIWVPWIVFTAICLVVVWRREGLKKLYEHSMSNKLLVLGMGVFDTLAWLFLAISVLETELSVAIAITESYPAIAIFLGLWINKEKILPHQYAGAAIALIASFALGFLA